MTAANMLQRIFIQGLMVCTLFANVWSRQDRQKHKEENDLSLWINEQQVKMFSGYEMKLYAIEHGKMNPNIEDPNFNKYIPQIPSDVNNVNFTWKSGTKKKYMYDFDILESLQEHILKTPTLTIKRKGRIPQRAKEFSVSLPCNGNSSGIAHINIGLTITGKGKPISGTPLRLSLKKECARRGVYDRSSLSPPQEPDPECDKKCANSGWCNEEKICQCPSGYSGSFCETAFCFPQCMNGGNCTAHQYCTCRNGYQGRHCEGGICAEKCLNGGKCIQKDECRCSKGYFGLRCEYSRCAIPCMNGGKCIGSNICRCPNGLGGNHCEIERHPRSSCKRSCNKGTCMPNGRCRCLSSWYGRFCNQREKRGRDKARHNVNLDYEEQPRNRRRNNNRKRQEKIT